MKYTFNKLEAGILNYRTGQHRTLVFEHLASQTGVYSSNRLPQLFEYAPRLKAFTTRRRGILQVSYNVDE